MRPKTTRHVLKISMSLAALLADASYFGMARADDANMIVLKNFHFSPVSLSVPAGSTVVWKNLDGEPHTVVSDSGVFRSGGLDQNDSYSFKFDHPGTYRFICSIHPMMVGTITVK